MRKLLALEELAMLLVCLFLLFRTSYALPFSTFMALFFVPDLFAMGYLLGKNSGTALYNFSHHKAVALLLFAFGFAQHQLFVEQLGLVFFAHSSFDRVLGYGLKYREGFHRTHLGYIGKEKHRNTPDTF